MIWNWRILGALNQSNIVVHAKVLYLFTLQDEIYFFTKKKMKELHYQIPKRRSLGATWIQTNTRSLGVTFIQKNICSLFVILIQTNICS